MEIVGELTLSTHSRRSTFVTKCPQYVANRTLVSYVATRFELIAARKSACGALDCWPGQNCIGIC
jgi:hypothetical protein